MLGFKAAVRTVPLPAYLIPQQRWKLARPLTTRELVFPGEPDAGRMYAANGSTDGYMASTGRRQARPGPFVR